METIDTTYFIAIYLPSCTQHCSRCNTEKIALRFRGERRMGRVSRNGGKSGREQQWQYAVGTHSSPRLLSSCYIRPRSVTRYFVCAFGDVLIASILPCFLVLQSSAYTTSSYFRVSYFFSLACFLSFHFFVLLTLAFVRVS